jgi:hypothetical protein
MSSFTISYYLFCCIFRPWYIKLPTHGILNPLTHGISTHGISTPLPVVCWPPYPWYIDPSLPMVYWPPYPWYFDPPTYGIMNSSLLVEMRGGGGSIYHEGVQNKMTKNLPQGQNSIWKIEPGVKIWYENWPQFTMGFKIPYRTVYLHTYMCKRKCLCN